MRKIVSILTATLLMGASLAANAITRGINYDPAHSSAFTTAQRNNNIAVMRSTINSDFAKINKLGFTTVKTFYSTFCTFAGVCLNKGELGQLAQNNGLKLLIGVFEFPANPEFTVPQVQAAIDNANMHPQTIVGIVVGNEDMYTFDGIPVITLQQRISNDIKTIKSKVSGPMALTVTTAQREPDWYRLKQKDVFNIIGTINVITANIYPFWGGSPEKINGVSVATNVIPAAVSKLQTAFPGKTIQVGEEGWPSCGVNPNTQDRTIAAETDYYKSWVARATKDTFNSFYFAAFDNQSVLQCTAQQPVGDANNYFGLCKDTGATKSDALVNCSV